MCVLVVYLVGVAGCMRSYSLVQTSVDRCSLYGHLVRIPYEKGYVNEPQPKAEEGMWTVCVYVCICLAFYAAFV